MFKLDKLPGYNDISSLNDAKYAITGVFIEQIGYPLWSLKYLTDEFIQMPPKLTMNDKMQQLITNLVDISEDKDQRNVQLRTTTLALIGDLRQDFKDIVKKPGAFQNGFENFLFSEPVVKLQTEELEEVMTFIRQNLQSTVGFWSEEEVNHQLLVWRASSIPQPIPPTPSTPPTPAYPTSAPSSTPNSGEPNSPSYVSASNLQKKKVKARELIDSITCADELRQILDRVIDLNFVAVLNVINGEEND